MTDWWDDVDEATLDALAAAGGRLTLSELAHGLGMSEEAVRSVVAMLAEQGRVRIAAVELGRPHGLRRAARGPAQAGGLDHRDSASAS
jgi:DNA-binding Lrp family transcriptional regulator